MSEKLVEIKDLEISFGEGSKKFVAVKNANFFINKGETFSLVGESGSGKTTIGRAIIGLNNTSKGEIIFDGHKINGKKSHKESSDLIRRIQMIFQDPAASLNERATVDYIISGGQTMNPSTEDFIKAVEQVNARNIIILPNNKNIFMAAQSAAEVIEQPAAVIETRTIPQGLTSLLAFDGGKTIEENQERMTAALSEVVSGSVTTAVRDTTIDGLEIHENDNLGMVDGKIVVSNPDMLTALKETFSKMLNEDSEIVSIYIGEDGSEELASSLAQDLMEQFEDVEVEIHQGSQPVYPYIFSVE